MGLSDLNATFDPHTLGVGFVVAIAILGYMVFQDWRDGKFNRDRMSVPETGDPVLNRFLGELAQSMGKLQAHYNDETTKVLTDLQVEHRDMFALLRKIMDIVEKNGLKADEILKYGVPVYRGVGRGS